MSSTGKFLPIQLIYTGIAPRNLPEYDFQSHFVLDLLRTIGQIQINLSSFLMKSYFLIYKAGKGGKVITTRATLVCYYGHLQRTGQWHSKRVLL